MVYYAQKCFSRVRPFDFESMLRAVSWKQEWYSYSGAWKIYYGKFYTRVSEPITWECDFTVPWKSKNPWV